MIGSKGLVVVVGECACWQVEDCRTLPCQVAAQSARLRETVLFEASDLAARSSLRNPGTHGEFSHSELIAGAAEEDTENANI